MVKIIEPSYTIETELNGNDILKKLEACARVCYQSSHKSGENTASKLIRKIIKNKHDSVLEHFSITVRIIHDRGFAAELRTHRLASHLQESTRLVDYEKNNSITVIKPFFFEELSDDYFEWLEAVSFAEAKYLKLRKNGRSPQEARTVLPLSLKVEMVVTANIREWRTILQQRTASGAHPQMKEIMLPLLKDFKRLIPVVFDDI